MLYLNHGNILRMHPDLLNFGNMETINKDLLVSLIQNYAIGKVNSEFSPQILAESIFKQVNINQPIDIFLAGKNKETIKKVSNGLPVLKKDMENELEKLDEEEKLFANFLRGKITAYQEINDLLK